MLPVQIWHERGQEAEAIEFGNQARVDRSDRDQVSSLRANRKEEDS
jgi:hypothetical protein